MKWRVYLGNQHAMCRVYAEADTKNRAFRKAFNKAKPQFRHYKLADHYGGKLKADKLWIEAFLNCSRKMTRSATSTSYENPVGFNVEIRRV